MDQGVVLGLAMEKPSAGKGNKEIGTDHVFLGFWGHI